MKMLIVCSLFVFGMVATSFGDELQSWLDGRRALAEKRAAQAKSAEQAPRHKEYTLTFRDGRRWVVMEYSDYVVIRLDDGSTVQASISR